MVNEKIIIPQENIYKTEEVRYLDNELQKKPITEKDFFVGCPNEDSDKAKAAGLGVAGMIGTGLLSIVCPPAGAAVATTYGVLGGAAKITNHVAKNERVKDVAEIFDIAFNISAAGGGASKLSGGKCMNHTH